MEYTFAGLPLPLRIQPPYPLTDDQLMRFSETHRPFPVERDEHGELLIMIPTGFDGSDANAEVVFELQLWNRQTGGTGKVTESNGGYALADSSVRAPDAAWPYNQRLAGLTAEQRRGYVPLCPQFVIELWSELDRILDVEQKMEMWMRNGAELAWLIDPQSKIVTIYRQGKPPERLDTISRIAGEGPVAGCVLPLDRICR